MLGDSGGEKPRNTARRVRETRFPATVAANTLWSRNRSAPDGLLWDWCSDRFIVSFKDTSRPLLVSVRRTRVMNVKGTMPLGCAMSYFIQSVEWCRMKATLGDWLTFKSIFLGLHLCDLVWFDAFVIWTDEKQGWSGWDGSDGYLKCSEHSEQSYELTQGDSDISCKGDWWLSQAKQILCSNHFQSVKHLHFALAFRSHVSIRGWTRWSPRQVSHSERCGQLRLGHQRMHQETFGAVLRPGVPYAVWRCQCFKLSIEEILWLAAPGLFSGCV